MAGALSAMIAAAFKSSAGYTIIQTFTATSTWTCPTGVTQVEYLVVAGGASGGCGRGGGGGAGGFRTGTGLSVTAGTDYTITVGAGGTSQTTDQTVGNNGNNSVFSSITSAAGGYGGAYLNKPGGN